MSDWVYCEIYHESNMEDFLTLQPTDHAEVLSLRPTFTVDFPHAVTSRSITVFKETNGQYLPYDSATFSSTSHTPSFDYDPADTTLNTSYRWTATATLATGGTVSTSAYRYFDIVASPDVPQPYLPTNFSETIDPTPSLGWTAIAGATSYDLELYQWDGSVYQLILDLNLSYNAYTPTSALPYVDTVSNDGYAFHVRAHNTSGASDWSAYSYFDIISGTIQPPASPAPYAPANHVELTTKYPTISWNSVSDAQEYRIQVMQWNGFGYNTIYDQVTYGTQFIITSPLTSINTPKNTGYAYRVYACNDGGCSDWSTTRYFDVIGP